MTTKNKGKIDENTPEFKRGFIDGFIGAMLKPTLAQAAAESCRLAELDTARDAMKGLTLEQIAQRAFDARYLLRGAVKFNAIVGRKVM